MRVRHTIRKPRTKPSPPQQTEQQRRPYRKKGKTDLSESGLRCTRCEGRSIVFLRGEGKVYCNPCKIRFSPPCCETCQHPETKPHHAKERRWRCLACKKTFTVAGAGSPASNRRSRRRRSQSYDDDDEEFDCVSLTGLTISTNRPKRARQLKQLDVEESDVEEKDSSDEAMNDIEYSDSSASEEATWGEQELVSSQESGVNSSIDCLFDATSISDMHKIGSRLMVMMFIYGPPDSYDPLMKELESLISAFDRSKLALCGVNTLDLDPLETMAYTSTLALFVQTTYETAATLLNYAMIAYYREKRDVMRLIMQFLISVANTKLIEFALAPYLAQHICTLAYMVDRYCTVGTHDAYILDAALILLRMAAVYLASPTGSMTQLNTESCGKVFASITYCLRAMVYRPLSQKTVWGILLSLKQHPAFSAFMMASANSAQLAEIIKETQRASSAGGNALMSSVRDSIELCMSAYLPSYTHETPDQPARVTDCRRDDMIAPAQAVN